MGKKTKESIMGRPAVFSPEIGREICKRLITYSTPNNSLRHICEEEDMPCRQSVYNWLLDASSENASTELKDFLYHYKIATEIKADNNFDELAKIASDTEESTGRCRLKVDTLKWCLSKMMPKKYGDRIITEHEFNAGDKANAIADITGAFLKKMGES